MNQQAQARWEQMKGTRKKIWGEITEDDIKKAEGSADKLYLILLEKFGSAKEAIQTQLDKLQRK